MKTTEKTFDDVCADFALQAQNILCRDMFRQDFCIRYSKKQGAYFTFEEYNSDIIIMHGREFRRDYDLPQQIALVKKTLRNKPFYAN